MTTDSTPAAEDSNLFLGEAWFDPIEAGIRDQIRGFIEGLIEDELATALGRSRYQRRADAPTDGDDPATPEVPDALVPATGHRHGHRRRQLQGSFGAALLAVPHARLQAEDGGTRERRSAVLPPQTRPHGLAHDQGSRFTRSKTIGIGSRAGRPGRSRR